jgi:hypothetical protein
MEAVAGYAEGAQNDDRGGKIRKELANLGIHGFHPSKM